MSVNLFSGGNNINSLMAAGKNAVINGGFDIWQRGTSVAISTSGSYLADRWQGYRGVTGSTYSRQTTSDTTNLPNIQYCARIQRDSGNTSTSALHLQQNFESVNSIPFAGKTVTLSFYARAGANFSAASSALSVQLASGTGTDQNLIFTPYTGAAYPINTTSTLTTTWQRFTYTGTVATTATELAILFYYTAVGTAGAADYFEITGVQLELGSVATVFTRTGGTIATELAACQRYYFRNTLPTSTVVSFAIGRSSTQCDIVLPLPVTMRTNPTAIEYGGGTFSVTNPNVSSVNLTGFTFSHASYQTAYFRGDAASGLAQGTNYIFQPPTSGYLGFSAEL